MDTQASNNLLVEIRELLFDKLRVCENYPRYGVSFADFNKAFADPDSLNRIACFLSAVFPKKSYSIVAAPEARGFIVGPILAYINGGSFVPVRKKGKLPNFPSSESLSGLLNYSYATEYSVDTLCVDTTLMDEANNDVVIYDDILASGGTAEACLHLTDAISKGKKRFIFLAEIVALGGREFLKSKGVLDSDIYSLIEL